MDITDDSIQKAIKNGHFQAVKYIKGLKDESVARKIVEEKLAPRIPKVKEDTDENIALDQTPNQVVSSEEKRELFEIIEVINNKPSIFKRSMNKLVELF